MVLLSRHHLHDAAPDLAHDRLLLLLLVLLQVLLHGAAS
jgi:hypothetical protein